MTVPSKGVSTAAFAGKVMRRSRLELGRLVERVLELRYSVQSARHDTLEELDLAGPDRNWHHPSDWISVRRALSKLGVSDRDVFLDFGSGRGRAVLIAAGFPFARVVGVELSEELTAIAQENLERYRGPVRAGQVELVSADATEYAVPDDLTVAYFYAPFTGETFARVLSNLLESVDREPRVLRVVYNYPTEHNQLVATGRARVLDVSPRSWPARPEAPDDVIVMYLLLPSAGPDAIPGQAPEVRSSVQRAPEWLGPYEPGFHLDRRERPFTAS